MKELNTQTLFSEQQVTASSIFSRVVAQDCSPTCHPTPKTSVPIPIWSRRDLDQKEVLNTYWNRNLYWNCVWRSRIVL